jgi:hypothetical protein
VRRNRLPNCSARASWTSCWGEPATYDLMLSTDLVGRDLAAELLARLMLGLGVGL